MLENARPRVFARSADRVLTERDEDETVADEIDSREVFDLIRGINDPEHPLTLEELKVVEEAYVSVTDAESMVVVAFTPTIPHCSMATLIGLAIRVQLLRCLPERFKVQTYPTIDVQKNIPTYTAWQECHLVLCKAGRCKIEVDVHIAPGMHASEHAVNKQLADKERVAAALENSHLLGVVNQCLGGRKQQ